MRKSDLASWFLNARNISQKQGATFIGTAVRKEGQVKFFQSPLIEANETVLDAAGRMLLEAYARIGDKQESEDIAAKSKRHLIGLLTVIHNCFQAFGPVIDSEQYYTRENMSRLCKTVEDFEAEVGLPPGWTAGLPEERRLIALRHQAGETGIDELFCKYLGVDRFGDKCNE